MNKEKEPITAEAFFSTHWNLGKPIDEIMVLFAKWHVKEALNEACEESKEDYAHHYEHDSLQRAILNCYPEDRIK